jgi:hypothetical protein
LSAALADDDRQLALVVDLARLQRAGQLDRVAVRTGGVGALHEQHGKLGNLQPRLVGVLAVIQADAQDVGRGDWREQLAHVGGAGRELEVAGEGVALELDGRTFRVRRAVAGLPDRIGVTDNSHSDGCLVRCRAEWEI